MLPCTYIRSTAETAIGRRASNVYSVPIVDDVTSWVKQTNPSPLVSCNMISSREQTVKEEVMKYMQEVKVPMMRHEEAMTLKCLKLPNQYSRYFNVCPERSMGNFPWPPTCENPYDDTELRENGKRVIESNSIGPFSTLGKRGCGCVFDPQADNKRYRTGLSTMKLGPWKEPARPRIGLAKR